MDYAGLKTQIALPAYAGMTDAQIAAAITTVNVTVYSSVPTSQWEGYLLSHGFLVAMAAYAATPPTGAGTLAIVAIKTIMLLISSPAVSGIDLSDATTFSEVQVMLSALVAEGTAGRLASVAGVAFAATDVTAMMAMGTTTVSIAQQLGFNPAVNDMAQEIPAARLRG